MSTVPWAHRVGEAFAADLFGDEVAVLEGFGPVTVEVPPERWLEALTLARDVLGCTFFDWLSAVDETEPLADGEVGGRLRVVCHLAARRTPGVEHLLVRTLLTGADPVLTSSASVFAGARWHERETHEMFGVDFTEAGVRVAMEPLLLPDGFEGHPLRKDFQLAARVDREWPGAKEPGEPDASRSRRRARPLGVPDPDRRGPQ